MNTNTVLRFLGWAALTYMWLDANCLFFNAIADAIHQHNEEIRQNAVEEYADESESENEEEQRTIISKSYIYTQCLTTSS